MNQLENRWHVAGIKYGFVYKWYDDKRGRYYIGSHWGKFGDRYICSSNSMREAYRRRPETFRRRILTVVTTNKSDLLDLEQKYLNKIPRKDFGDKAYNVSTKVHRPWWAKGSKLKKETIAKLCKSQKKVWKNPELRARAAKTASRISKRMWKDPECRKRHLQGLKQMWENMDPSTRARHSRAMSANAKNRWKNPDYRKYMSQIATYNQTGKKASSEARKNMSLSQKKRYEDPAERAERSFLSRKMWSRNEYRKCHANAMKKIHGDPAYRKLQSRIAKQIRKDPKFRARHALAMKKVGIRFKEERNKPEFRRNQSLSHGGSGILLTSRQESYVRRVFTPRHPEYGINALMQKFGVSGYQIRRAIK